MLAVATGCSRQSAVQPDAPSAWRAMRARWAIEAERSHRQPHGQNYGGKQMARAIAPDTFGAPGQSGSIDRSDPTYQAWQLLHIGFTVAPIVFGLDKFFGLLVNWDQYLAPAIANL